MQKDEYKEWLIKWFSKSINVPSDAMTENFFNAGWLDSFKTLELILEIETEFKISLPNSVLSDLRFSSIIGLSEILYELKNTNGTTNA